MPRYLGEPPTFNDFIGRNQKYYEELANACNGILLIPPSQKDLHAKKVENYPNFKRWEFRGDDRLLPPTIRNLHASSVSVESNSKGGNKIHSQVIIWYERSYWIKWKQFEDGNGPWILSAGDEYRDIVVYTAQK